MNTIHSDDVAGALWACAQWMAPLGRAEADRVAGEEVHFHNEKSKVSEVTGMPPATQKVVVPLFNIVSPSSGSNPLSPVFRYSSLAVGRRQSNNTA